MSTPSFDAYLSADHRYCDQQLGALRRHASSADWGNAQTAFAALRHGMLAHFSAEEDVLFPAYEAVTGMRGGPTQVMRMEHAEVRLLLDDLAAALDAQAADEIRGHAEALLILLQQHNMKEEHILYPAARDAAGPQLAAWSAEVQQHREAGA